MPIFKAPKHTSVFRIVIYGNLQDHQISEQQRGWTTSTGGTGWVGSRRCRRWGRLLPLAESLCAVAATGEVLQRRWRWYLVAISRMEWVWFKEYYHWRNIYIYLCFLWSVAISQKLLTFKCRKKIDVRTLVINLRVSCHISVGALLCIVVWYSFAWTFVWTCVFRWQMFVSIIEHYLLHHLHLVCATAASHATYLCPNSSDALYK